MTTAVRTLLLLLSPFAPHMSAELWQALPNQMDASEPVHSQAWPSVQDRAVLVTTAVGVIQVNGKFRGLFFFLLVMARYYIEFLVRSSSSTWSATDPS
jgi:leucyl-tRNA synthetase